MVRPHLWLAALLAFVLVNQAQVQGTIALDCGCPQSGSSSGAIALKGTVTPSCGWSLSSCTVTVRAWQDGCVLSTATVDTSTSCCVITFDGAITGLQSGATYNITVEVQVTNGCQTVTVVTDAATASAACFSDGTAVSQKPLTLAAIMKGYR
jgi:hypothetical protein